MSEFKKLKDKHAKEIKELQDSCSHEEISDWTRYMWAPGHFGGSVKYCLRCGFYMEKSWDATQEEE